MIVVIVIIIITIIIIFHIYTGDYISRHCIKHFRYSKATMDVLERFARSLRTYDYYYNIKNIILPKRLLL